MENNYYLYVLLCGDKSLYGGITNNLEQRLLKHQSGKGAKYTRSHLPVKMIYSETFSNKSDALKAEYYFKHQSRKKKIAYLLKNGINVF
ncbi:GIY-YIG nuclease family protein [Apilactobacillus apisilvae]|uniref:GIY-YIG nuclease family protein n=1 Tax=Apilactobacillus apisilvae TaxID=2923364 RepID=A0ABY4PI40_9LACO|nr:GIY-YIG nuclease family protein [Apilactobacillus apisilvae]UQS85488.1 GIY-YIG nuclease family protein [Apilactobacillus apisilvae]